MSQKNSSLYLNRVYKRPDFVSQRTNLLYGVLAFYKINIFQNKKRAGVGAPALESTSDIGEDRRPWVFPSNWREKSI